MGEVQEIELVGDMIRLGQLLKLSGLADSGGEAREFLRAGGVTVNGEPEARRGRQLHRGDVVAAGEQAIRVV
jgi:ribosome-associated protein